MFCPKCGYQKTTTDDKVTPEGQCPACGIYYFKYINQQNKAIKPEPQNNEKPPITTEDVKTKEVLIKYLDTFSMRIRLLIRSVLQQMHHLWNRVIKNPMVIVSLIITSLLFGLFWIVAPAYMKDKVVGLITFPSAERQCFNYHKDNFKDPDTAYIKVSSILTKNEGMAIMGGNPYEIYEKFDSYVVVNVQAKNSMGGYGSELIKCPLVDNRFDRAFVQSLDILQRANDLYKQGENAKALPLFQSFAEHGNAEAQYRLGYMYNTINFSKGVAWDNTQAIYWYNKAAEQGNADAQIDLVVMYSNGTAKDDTKSVYWHNRLEENVGIKHMLQRANDLYNTFDHSNFLRAFALYQHLAEHGDAKAQYRIGNMYYQGWGVDEDHTQAIYWYKKAADQGDDAAKRSLKDLS